MRTTSCAVIVAAGLAVCATGCGDVVRQGRGPTQVVLHSLMGASGATPGNFSGNLSSDVITNVERQVADQTVVVPTVFSDPGQVTMSLILKDPGSTQAAAAPSAINQITFTRYRVAYRRSDGRNTPGVDVPYAFDGAMTLTVPPSGSVSGTFELVRIQAKEEAPLRTLRTSSVVISTIGDVTFYGRDQAGNEVIAAGSIGISFGNFGDPE